MEVSKIQAEDYSRVVEVWEASVRATHHFVANPDIEIFRPMVTEGLHHVNLIGVRDTAGIVVGFAGIADGKVEMLFIDPAWRGKGIGRLLLQHAVDELGATELDVNEQNEQALGFYLRMGFEVIGRSELDSTGKPYPILHMRVKQKQGV